MNDPLSNAEVLKILNSKTQHTETSKEFKEYLELIKNDNKYSMTSLRKLKDITSPDYEISSQELLCMICNIQDIRILSESDKKKIIKISQED